MMIKKYAKVYAALVRLSLNVKSVYRVNFWVGLLTDINFNLMHIVVFLTILNNVDTIGGWNQGQMLFFMGTFIVIGAMSNLFYFSGLIRLPGLIASGDLDLYLTKPVNALFFVTLQDFNFGAVFNLLFGVVVLVFGAATMQLPVTLAGALGYAALVPVMCGLNYTMTALLCSAAFWFVKTYTLLGVSSELFNFAYRVPGVLYRGWAKLLFYVVLPYGLLFTIPAQFFFRELTLADGLLALLVAAAFWALLALVWKRGRRRYASARS